MSEVVLLAPFAGWLTPLDEVPDPVFAERMMGEGVAVDPTDALLRAPADATVIAIPDTAHAVTLKLANGAELLIHVGLETVALEGQGFRAVATAGARVKAGDPLIEVDLGAVAREARSLVTPIVVANKGFAVSIETPSRRVHAGDRIGTVEGEAQELSAGGAEEVYERTVVIDAAHGLHARPAARIAAGLKPYRADVTITHSGQIANARSTVALMGLGVRQGDNLTVAGQGEQARAAVDAVIELIKRGLGEEAAAPGQPDRRSGPVCAAPGLAVGTVVQFRAIDLPVPEDGEGLAEERSKLASALREVALGQTDAGAIAAELAAAHRELLEDPELRAQAERDIAQGRSAAFAWRAACSSAREILRGTGDALLAERAADLLDIERRVIAALLGGTAPEVTLPVDAILVAPDLLPSEFDALDRSKVVGICTAAGGPTSHVAILAASAGIPMIVAAGTGVLDVLEGSVAILDADHAEFRAEPTDDQLAEARARSSRLHETRAAQVREAQEPCYTADGTRIEVFANLGSAAEATVAVEAGAEGCGLLRTEFLFLGRDTPPSEEEQRSIYAEIAASLGDRPLIVRTFDIGADKPAPYLALAKEENPALGLRGVRLSLARPDLFATQLRAILRGVPAEQRRIMLPMVADLQELRDARALLRSAEEDVGSRETPLGIMVETPASALLADKLAADADFLSVGTNDLTQYVLAADRTNAAVSRTVDAFHPAVLRLIDQAARGAAGEGKWIGVCGGLASDPLATAILVGLGVTELSAASAQVPAIKAAVRGLRMDACRLAAERACAASSAAEARAIAAEALK